MSAEKRHGLLIFNDWSVIDPSDPDLEQALKVATHHKDFLTLDQIWMICRAARAFIHLATHPGPSKLVIEQLKEIRKALK